MNRIRTIPELGLITVPRVLLKCGISLLLAVIFTALTIGFTQLFFASIVSDTSFKASMLAGLIVLFITFATAWGVLQDITAIVKRYHDARKKRRENTNSQE